MHTNRIRVYRYAAVVIAALSLAAASSAQPNGPAPIANIRIDNFGKINDHYYRGAQPDGQEDYADLAALGIRTVIDLTKDGRSDEQGMVERAGMKFYRIEMTTSDRPADTAVERFLELVNNPANQPVYVHCQGGRHRTGVMTAVYRMTQDGWSSDQAYDEMKQFNFEGFPGHPTLKRFDYAYYTDLNRSPVAPKPAVVAAAAISPASATDAHLANATDARLAK
jgi:protein tyrosine/serine phosphatase